MYCCKSRKKAEQIALHRNKLFNYWEYYKWGKLLLSEGT